MNAWFVLVTALANQPGLEGVERGSEYICTNGDKERRVQVIYPQGAPLPCEVHYIKATENQVLWSANNEAGYCEAKAQAFSEKLKTMWWSCTKND
ncbi:hypothetical protein [Ferrimonas aestuarii]|uniref:Uncharacterized protein n=1 Tax=Ferrimonas aestuarii TaxID=2569539 RepID=A0A4U1BNQ7_9GAMM|nr:hypothetical protein [Ferrimonas aestuarii]TKB53674.1 hypothetical protein FCL42_13940 [Ferrimonas aestuarii]